MKKTILIILLVIYAISFSPFSDIVYLGGEEVASERIRSNFGDQELSGSIIGDFLDATLNTVLFNLPAHYGSFISMFDEQNGKRLKLYSFSHRFKKPAHPTSGWIVGQVFGWIIRIGLLVLIILQIRKLSPGSDSHDNNVT